MILSNLGFFVRGVSLSVLKGFPWPRSLWKNSPGPALYAKGQGGEFSIRARSAGCGKPLSGEKPLTLLLLTCDQFELLSHAVSCHESSIEDDEQWNDPQCRPELDEALADVRSLQAYLLQRDPRCRDKRLGLPCSCCGGQS